MVCLYLHISMYLLLKPKIKIQPNQGTQQVIGSFLYGDWHCDFCAFLFKIEVTYCACLIEVHEKKNAGFWSDSLHTCQIYFAFLKKLYYLYSFSKSVAFLSMIPKANPEEKSDRFYYKILNFCLPKSTINEIKNWQLGTMGAIHMVNKGLKYFF